MADLLTLFLTVDVMTGRGIDQILPYSEHPRLDESYGTRVEVTVEAAGPALGGLGVRPNRPLKLPPSTSADA
jgi:hypothetical protein